MIPRLPRPACRYGYTDAQVRDIVGPRLDAFRAWHRGQTGAICNGREYDPAGGADVATGCGPHGMIVYPDDLRRFLAGLPDAEFVV